MHLNYYFLKQLTEQLKPFLLNSTLAECYSQNKNELIFGFYKGNSEFFIKALFDGGFSIISFPKKPMRARKNSIDIFGTVIDQSVSELYVFENERSFCIEFDGNFQLVFKLHGNRSNIILFNNEQLDSLFRNDLIADKEIRLNELHRPIDQSAKVLTESNFELKRIYPTFDTKIKIHLESKNFELEAEQDKIKIIEQLLTQLKDSNFYFYEQDGIPYLSLLSENHAPVYTTKNAIDACNYLAANFISNYYLNKEKKVKLNELKKAIRKCGNYIIKSNSKLDQIKSSIGYDEIANILMANLHTNHHSRSNIELFDFYRDQQIKIKLKKDVTLQKNAEIYYRKAKNQTVEIDNLVKNISVKKKEKEAFQSELEELEQINQLGALRKYQKSGTKKSKPTQQTKAPYIAFEIDGYKVLVGKSARNNDELISKYASKNDLWLHARGVSGSHVIIKEKKGTNFPLQTIESVAMLAAWHSKGKNDTLCPVIYTPRKFVRKPKGALPGQVIVEKEEVILVKPCRSVQ